MRYFLLNCLVSIYFCLISGENISYSGGEINIAQGNFVHGDSIIVQIDSLIRNFGKTKHCRVIGKISRPGQKAFYRGYDGRKDYKITDFSEAVEIGSCTKMFTATAIMQLIEKKKISLQTRLVDIIPDPTLYHGLCVINGKDYIDSVRIFHLLNHSSGIPDYFLDGKDEDEITIHGDSSLRFTPEQLIVMAKSNKPYFIPGTGFKYSNTNYILLGMVIEKLTDMKYYQYIQLNILDPLKMKQTYFASRKSTANRASGYYKNKKVTMPATLAGSAGEIISTLDDMQIFISAWSDGRLYFQDSTLETIKKQYYMQMSGDVIKYGLGVVNILDMSLGHAGQTFGFQFYAGCTKNGSCFIISTDDFNASIWEPAIYLSGLLK